MGVLAWLDTEAGQFVSGENCIRAWDRMDDSKTDHAGLAITGCDHPDSQSKGLGQQIESTCRPSTSFANDGQIPSSGIVSQSATAWSHRCSPAPWCRRFPTPASRRHPQGWQAVVRKWDRQCLVVLHAFAGAPGQVTVPWVGGWNLAEIFGGPAVLEDGGLKLPVAGDFSAVVELLER